MQRRSHQRDRSAFTIIELLVVVSIIALLIGLLLPAISRARDQAKQTASLTNLRNLGTAHGSYEAEWNGRQFTLINDNIGSYGDTNQAAFGAYLASGNVYHPGPQLGWGYVDGNGEYTFFEYNLAFSPANGFLVEPMAFEAPSQSLIGFGSFRLINVRQFNQYVSGRFYDKVFYAPKDTIVWNSAEGGDTGYSCFDDPGEYCDRPELDGFGDIPTWSSYILSPAAMLNPQVMRRRSADHPTFRSPWEYPGGLRSPASSMAKYSSLKTRMLEHHWLQNRRAECNPNVIGGAYSGCEPYYFNAAWESSPMTLFYDGHVGSVGIRKAIIADGRIRQQGTGYLDGLWLRAGAIPSMPDGYFEDLRYDQGSTTSFHIMTVDGILGRDIVSE